MPAPRRRRQSFSIVSAANDRWSRPVVRASNVILFWGVVDAGWDLCLGWALSTVGGGVDSAHNIDGDQALN